MADHLAPGAETARDWLERRRAESQLAFTHIDWARCAHWSMRDGALVHDTGGFFSVIGVAARSNAPALDGLAVPMIDQPEIGILGFLLRETPAGHAWLLQAKGEPGNANGVQIAPSVQATFSNYSRRHGGAPTEFLDYMLPEGDGAGRLIDVRQSEQGSLFFNKYNRNVAVLATEPPAPPSELWRWTPSAELRALLHTDYAINTDARSVLVSTPWRYLSDGGAPFARPRDAWTEALVQSHAIADPWPALTLLDSARHSVTLETRRVALQDLPHCTIAPNAIVSNAREPALTVRPYAVLAPEREIAAWSQPLVGRERVETARLLCTARDGVLRFYLRASPEIGFANIAQFGPSQQSDAFTARAAWTDAAVRDSRSTLRAAIAQSDEGGRFMRCITRYEIVEIAPDTAHTDADGVWVTLGDLEHLAAHAGALTNEARSVISLLLAWA